jgi:hypothetical protein
VPYDRCCANGNVVGIGGAPEFARDRPEKSGWKFLREKFKSAYADGIAVGTGGWKILSVSCADGLAVGIAVALR